MDQIEVPVSLRYIGDDYEGEMSAVQLATVLKSLSDFTQAIATPELMSIESPRVKVRAFREGSFEIQAVIDALANGIPWATVAAIVGASFRFYWKNMRLIVTGYRQLEDGNFEIQTRDHGIKIWTEQQWRLHNNKQARRAAAGIAKPLRSGADMELKVGAEVVEIKAGDASDFDEPVVDGKNVTRFETRAQPDIVSLRNRSRKWRLDAAWGSFSARIEDKQFLRDVHSGRIRVGGNDNLLLAMRIEAEADGDNGRPQYFVERVIEHYPGEEQDELPEEDSPAG